MPIRKLNIEEFLELAKTSPVLDVRSPAEYTRAHVPGAISFPIFNNDERRIIGTAYKQESREKAIKIGLESFGRNMVRLVEEAERITAERKVPSREIAVYCWRSGMRSAAVAWLLDLYGFKVYLLNRGYKAYRNWTLQQFEKNYRLVIVGGYTGGNKTGIIHELIKQDEPVIDLEALAVHKGSAFGNLEMAQQPSQEHFENLLAEQLAKQSRNPEKPIWIEGESQRLGDVNIPFSFYKTMRASPLLFLDIPLEQRLEHIVKQYGGYEKEKLINAIVRIKKRLGGLETKNAVNALLEDDVRGCFAILLKYYDKLYHKSTHNTQDGERPITYIESDTTEPKQNTEKFIHYGRTGKN
jgi:tRNA 2-selenouridine synthase